MKTSFSLLFFFVLGMNCFSQVNDPWDDTRPVMEGDTNPAPYIKPSSQFIDTSTLFDVFEVEEQPEFPGGYKQMLSFIKTNTNYPYDAADRGLQGKVFIAFVIERNGQVRNLVVTKGITNGQKLDEEAIRIISKMPSWKPGKIAGQTVRVKYLIPINFKLPDPNLEATFPGGKTALEKYIYSNLKYPKQAKKDKTEGYVTIAFEVDLSGKTVNATVLESLGHGCDEEALRLVNNMPKWTPGVNQKENTKTSVRIKFELKKK